MGEKPELVVFGLLLFHLQLRATVFCHIASVTLA
jgi:hypothetical protein